MKKKLDKTDWTLLLLIAGLIAVYCIGTCVMGCDGGGINEDNRAWDQEGCVNECSAYVMGFYNSFGFEPIPWASCDLFCSENCNQIEIWECITIDPLYYDPSECWDLWSC